MCSRPAVSMRTASTSCSTPAFTASNATLAGSDPSGPRTVGTPTRSPQVVSWSAAAARNVSAAPSSTSLSCATSTRAILPTVVVLPTPLTPTTITTAGLPLIRSACRLRSSDGSRRATSSSRRSAEARSPEADSTRIRVLRASTSSCVGATPTSAASRVSSISSQVASSSPVPGEQGEQPLAQRRLRTGQPCPEPLEPSRDRVWPLDLEDGGVSRLTRRHRAGRHRSEPSRQDLEPARHRPLARKS